ncbi:hypothetical protein BO94DRAFT_504897 [Aspergillus sclerotioniger CBS 115572]|uniref:Uncharacterized protein n=1 Tax=Aspergillus sclerotioniger CBS 115572 TaxID=1450535 RepID=A0A317UZ35_9EURO|nr:hypothetical protein BO94DRAFT_504897 [Aspergillus sclerotioniger CBS 115572]PWY65260.1 hypothetical protein BO94DRAFT_504897 [Aspergillus sclerotioniger CBS 115572]
MARVSVRRIYFGDWVTDFLQHILSQDAPSTLILVCSTRELFLEQLLAASYMQPTEAVKRHRILAKTIGLLSKSRRIKLIFCPTLEHLRAYLSVMKSPENIQNVSDKEGQTKRPLVAILNPLALHMSTSEFSAQGLSRTFALAVEVSSRAQMDLVLCECRDAADPADSGRGEVLWYTQVPLLNGSVRIGEESTSFRRGVPVKRVVERWFDFNENEHPVTDTIDI